MLAQHDLLQLFVFLGEEDEIFYQAQQIRHRAKRLDLGFQIADFFVLPAEYIAPHRVPGRAVVEADRFRCGEKHLRHHDFRRLDMVAADLIDTERNPLLFGRVLTLDHQHRDAVDEKNHILPCAVMSIVEVKLFRDFVDVAPVLCADARDHRSRST